MVSSIFRGNLMADFEPKVRITVPAYIQDILNTDMYDFDLTKNKICNEIFFAFHQSHNEQAKRFRLQESTILQFTLSNENLDLFIKLTDQVNFTNKAEFFRQMFFDYCSQPRYVRELSLNEKSIKLVNKAIKEQKQLRIRYKDGLRLVEPYALLKSDNETRNYVYVYCHNKHDYCIYRLANIEAVSITANAFEHYDQSLIDGIRHNFDPFLSYGQTVKARLTEAGFQIYERNITHRPQISKQDGNTYEFECSAIRAKLYFPKFFGEVEILEPLELREWFKNGIKNMMNVYQVNGG